MTNDLSQCGNCIYHYTYNGQDMCKQVGDDFYLQWKVENCPYHTTITRATAISDEIYRLRAENADLRERLDKSIILPCKVGDIIYIITFGYNGKHVTPNNFADCWSYGMEEVEVTEENLFIMCSHFRDGSAFFDRASAEKRLAELKGMKK